MESFTFPIGGSQGHHECWDGEMSIDISDRDAARLVASAKRATSKFIEDDPAIADVLRRIEKKIIHEQKEEYRSIGMLEELALTWPNLTEDERVAEDMGFWRVSYPEELQVFIKEEEDEEE